MKVAVLASVRDGDVDNVSTATTPETRDSGSQNNKVSRPSAEAELSSLPPATCCKLLTAMMDNRIIDRMPSRTLFSSVDHAKHHLVMHSVSFSLFDDFC
jgi:hypothetical protein